MLEQGELETGRGKNQETNLQRHGKPRWLSHHVSIVRLLAMFNAVVTEFTDIARNGEREARAKASGMVKVKHTFDFCMSLHIMS